MSDDKVWFDKLKKVENLNESTELLSVGIKTPASWGKKYKKKKKSRSAPPGWPTSFGVFDHGSEASGDGLGGGDVGGLGESLKIEVDDKDFSFKSELNPKLWYREELRPEVKRNILDLAKTFFSDLKVEGKLVDILITGSSAGYNWHEKSDIDVHLVVDVSEDLRGELVKDYFYLAKTKWNNTHDIMLYGHEVEMYIRPSKEEEVSAGRYSVMNEEWISKPTRKGYAESALSQARARAGSYRRQVKAAKSLLSRGEEYDALNMSISVMNKISKMRQDGLDDAGELSIENLTFKILRNEGQINILKNIKKAAYDKIYTLDEQFHRFLYGE